MVHLVEVELLEVRVRLIIDITKHRAIARISEITTAHLGKVSLGIALGLQIRVLLVGGLEIWQRYDCLSR